MTTADVLLARLLGECHALFVPLRNPFADHWPAVWEARRLYPRNGLPWRAGGSKEQARALTSLVGAGLVRRVRGKEKTVGVIVTKEGILRGGDLVGFGRNEAECFTAELLKYGPVGHWVPEVALNNGRGWGDGNQNELVVIEDTGLQALALGYVTSNCDVRGRIFYRVTPAGWAAVQVWDGSVREPPEASQDAVESYRDGFETCLGRLHSLPRLAREIGEIPLPASWGLANQGTSE